MTSPQDAPWRRAHSTLLIAAAIALGGLVLGGRSSTQNKRSTPPATASSAACESSRGLACSAAEIDKIMSDAEADHQSSPKGTARVFKEPHVLVPTLAGGLLVLIAAMGLIDNSTVPTGRDPAGPAARLVVANVRREWAGSVAPAVLGGALLLTGLGVPLGGLATSERVAIVVVGGRT